MIYPTRRAIILMAAGAPLGLVMGLIAPGLWMAAGSWVALILGLTLIDAFLGATRDDVDVTLSAPSTIGMAGHSDLSVRVAFRRAPPPGACERLNAPPCASQ